MLNYIIHYGLIDYTYIRNRMSDFEELDVDVQKYSFNDIAQLFWVKPARIVELIHLYIRAVRPVIVANTDTIKAGELALLKDLMIITGNTRVNGSGLLPLRTPGNAQGQIDMGVTPDYLPGKRRVSDVKARGIFENMWNKSLPAGRGRDTEQIIDAVHSGEISGLVIFGMDAAGEAGNHIFEKTGFSLLFDSTVPEIPPYPDMVLPLATFLESNGTFTNSEGRIQLLQQALTPPSGRSNWKLIAELSGALGYKMGYDSIAQIISEIGEIIPDYKKAIASLKPAFPETEKKTDNDKPGIKDRKSGGITDKLKDIGKLVCKE
jgi:predicted molibdopterin-dependent oxidoreductase YjgC